MDKWEKLEYNTILKKNDKVTDEYFYISYNVSPPAGDSEETALCVNDTFYILDGDFRKHYEPLETINECMKVYDKYKGTARCYWSTDGDDRYDIDKLGRQKVLENLEEDKQKVTDFLPFLKDVMKEQCGK